MFQDNVQQIPCKAKRILTHQFCHFLPYILQSFVENFKPQNPDSEKEKNFSPLDCIPIIFLTFSRVTIQMFHTSV